MSAVVAAGYPYELVGIVYYVFFILMNRKQYVGNYTKRTRVLVVLAAIIMVGCVPLGYANTFGGVVAMLTIAAVALVSTLIDAIADQRRKKR